MIKGFSTAPTWAAWLLLAIAPQLHAQDYPRGPISLVIPLAAGDAADVAARTIAEELSRELKVPLVAVNRPGGGGAVGTDSVVKAKKDGYTIVFTNNAALVFRPVLDPQTATYDPSKDLVPLGLAARTPTLLAVRADAPFRTFAEMVEYAKKNPGMVRVGTAGVGSVGDFCVQTLNALSGAEITMVPFTGASPAVTALRGGHVEGVALALGTLSGQVKSGAFRGLVISSRVPEFPDVPTLTELGYPQNLFGLWFAFLAPAGVPAEVANALVPAIERAVKSLAVAARLAPLGIVQDYGPPDKVLTEIREEQKRVEDIARKTGLVKAR